MRGLPTTIVLLVVLGGLLGYIYFVDSKRETTDPNAKPKAYASLSAENIEELQIKAPSGETSRVQKVGEYLRFNSSLPARLNEFAILINARFWGSKYEWYAHRPFAIKGGLAESIADDLAQNRRPAGMKPCSSAPKKRRSHCARCSSGSACASARATRRRTSSAEASLPLAYFSINASRQISCSASVTAAACTRVPVSCVVMF